MNHNNENAVEVHNLSVRFGTNTVLEGVNLDVPNGEITVIIGGSGCGKTTLLRTIIHLTEPASGSVKLLGNDIASLEEDETDLLLRRVGVMFQQGALMNSLTVAENIALPLEMHTDLSPQLIERLIRQKLHMVELSHAYSLYPSELSGGMRKRAALARAIALEPEILFADEPSAGLDPVVSRGIDNLFLRMKQELGMTVVVVTHELASIHRIAGHIAFLSEGRMIFWGKPQEATSSGIPEVEGFFLSGRIQNSEIEPLG